MRSKLVILTMVLVFMLSVAYAGQVDGGSAIENAAVISLGEQYIGTMGDAIEEWFFFQADEGSAYYRADFKNEDIDTTLYMTAYDSSGIKIAEADAHKEHSDYLSWKIVPGETYYLKFNRYNNQSNGRFTLSLTRTLDEYANGVEGAGVISVDQTILTSFDGSGDKDYMTFVAEDGQAYYRADFKNETVDTTVYMTLLDENGLKIVSADASKDRNDYLSWLAAPGKTYYLEFTRYDEFRGGNYTVSLSRFADKEGNDLDVAVQPAVNTKVNASFDGSGDVDVFCITAGEGNLYYSVPFTNETVDTTVYMTLLDGNGYKIAEENAGMGYNSAISWKAEAGAVYYLRFTRYSDNKNGAYGFTINEIADNEPDVLPTDVTISNIETTTYILGGADDTDWLRLSPVEAGSYTNLVVANTGSRYINAALTDSNGTELDSRGIGYDSNWSIDCYQSPGSELYLRITGEQTGSYAVTQLVTPDIGGNTPADAVQLIPGESFVMAFERDNDADYASFLDAGSNILITVPEGSSVDAFIVDANGQQLSDEYWLYAGDSRLLCADRLDAYLCVRGYGSCILTACAPDNHVSSGVWTVTKEATCTEAGEQAMLCTICGQHAEAQELSAKGHTPDSRYLLVKEARCDDVGIEELHCKICSDVLEQRTIPATGHLNTYWDKVLEADCENEGLQLRICSDCGKQLEQERIPAFGHFPGEKTGKQPTCETDGYEQVACRLCGEVLEQNTLLAVGHTPGPMQLTVAAGCEETGLNESACQTCGKVLEQESIPATGHNFGEFVQVIAPTKDAEGREESVCANCDAVQTRAVEKLSFFEGLFK